jgi:tetratricopeptide (TPR) repeat protein
MILALLLTSALAAQTPEPAQAAPAASPAEAAAPAAPDAPEGDADALIETGLKAFARARYASAAKSFEAALAAAPESAAAHYYLGYCVYKLAEGKRRNHPDKARAAELFAKALQLDPRFRPVWAKPATPPPAQ